MLGGGLSVQAGRDEWTLERESEGNGSFLGSTKLLASLCSPPDDAHWGGWAEEGGDQVTSVVPVHCPSLCHPLGNFGPHPRPGHVTHIAHHSALVPWLSLGCCQGWPAGGEAGGAGQASGSSALGLPLLAASQPSPAEVNRTS